MLRSSVVCCFPMECPVPAHLLARVIAWAQSEPCKADHCRTICFLRHIKRKTKQNSKVRHSKEWTAGRGF